MNLQTPEHKHKRNFRRKSKIELCKNICIAHNVFEMEYFSFIMEKESITIPPGGIESWDELFIIVRTKIRHIKAK